MFFIQKKSQNNVKVLDKIFKNKSFILFLCVFLMIPFFISLNLRIIPLTSVIETYPLKSEEPSILDIEVYSNISSYETFALNDDVQIRYKLVSLEYSAYFMIFKQNSTIVFHQLINQEYFNFYWKINTSRESTYYLTLEIYTDEVQNLTSIDQDFLCYQQSNQLEIKDLNESGTSLVSFISNPFFSIGGIGILVVILGIYISFNLFQKIKLSKEWKQFSTKITNQKYLKEIQILQQKDSFFTSKNHRNILNFSNQSFSEIEIALNDFSEEEYWDNVISGGISL